MRRIILFATVMILMACAYFFKGDWPSGGKLSANQAAIDVHYYNLTLTVNTERKTVSGFTEVMFNLVENSIDSLELDLLNTFKISKVEIEGKTAHFSHNNNKLMIALKNKLDITKHITAKIYYSGAPIKAKNAPWRGGFVWSKDAQGDDWVTYANQFEGGKILFPCKDHPSDEPDSVAINITVNAPYIVASNGLLQKTTKPEPGKITYHWFTAYPTNNYSINFGIAKYKTVEAFYKTESGHDMPVTFWVLPEKYEGARELVDQAVDMLASYRTFFGEYPWTKEKFGILMADYLGMEHQTINAYGNNYQNSTVAGFSFDELLLHEMGHEWWGNKITVKDWADFWIHEGICTYGEALYLLDKVGEEAYHAQMAKKMRRIRNSKPIIAGKNLDTGQSYNGDIYNKGAAFMHSLRYIMGDTAFFDALKTFATDPAYTFKNLVTTQDFLTHFNGKSPVDITPFSTMLLYTTDIPHIKIKSDTQNSYIISLENSSIELPMDIKTGNGTQRVVLSKTPLTIKSSTKPEVDPKNWFLKNVSEEY